jgi:hypothetical protein
MQASKSSDTKAKILTGQTNDVVLARLAHLVGRFASVASRVRLGRLSHPNGLIVVHQLHTLIAATRVEDLVVFAPHNLKMDSGDSVL